MISSLSHRNTTTHAGWYHYSNKISIWCNPCKFCLQLQKFSATNLVMKMFLNSYLYNNLFTHKSVMSSHVETTNSNISVMKKFIFAYFQYICLQVEITSVRIRNTEQREYFRIMKLVTVLGWYCSWYWCDRYSIWSRCRTWNLKYNHPKIKNTCIWSCLWLKLQTVLASSLCSS